MQVTIVGAGAMGSLLGHGIARAGHRLSIVDLPHRVAELRRLGGIVVEAEDGSVSSAAPDLVTTDFAAPGPQDLVILATKAQELPALAPQLPALLHREAGATAVMSLQNGIPWWYCQGLDHPLAGTRLRSLDPDGLLERHVPSSAIVGCVAYPAAELCSDGRVVHVEGSRFPIGEIAGPPQPRTTAIADLLGAAGFKSRVLDDIRSELWLKAWGSLSINPVSALTRATMVDICSYPPTRDLIAAMMEEARTVAESLGVTFRHTIDKRIAGARAVGAHKTSMLQDLEAGRPLELDALMGAVLELAALTGHAVPAITAVNACTALLGEPLRRHADVPQRDCA